MRRGVYNSAKLVKSLSPKLSVRTFQGRYYLVDDERDILIAQAIQGSSTEWAKEDPLLWAIGRIDRRCTAIEAEVTKYKARIEALEAEHMRLVELTPEDD